MVKKPDVQIMIEGLDETNISSILSKYNDIVETRKELEKLEESLKNKVKIYLKERKWDSYFDEDTKMSISISKLSRETIDKKQLKIMLTDAQFAQVIRVSTYERINIVNPETREKLKKIVRKDFYGK